MRTVTLPLGESGSRARRGPSPAATASDPPASGRVKEIAQLQDRHVGLRLYRIRKGWKVTYFPNHVASASSTN